MAKKKQFVTAAAAFAVAASAVAPAITADAASTTVRLSSDYVRGGDLNAALDKEYKGSEIHWYKSSIDMNKLGVFQTAKGFVKGKGIKVEKKLRVLNYAQEIKPESEFVFEQGVPVSGIRVQPVLFADGVVYNKPLFVAGFSTEKVGEFEGTLTYSNKAYGSVTKTVKYKVVASKVEFSEVKHEVKDDMLSVSADVKNLKEGEKVELVIFPGKDESKPLDPYTAEIKDGKVMVSAKDIPAGTHSFILRSGDVKTAAMEFMVEELTPKVEKVSSNNLKEVSVEFTKAISKADIKASDFAVKGKTITNVNLSSDNKTATLTLDASVAQQSDVEVTAKKSIKFENGRSLEADVVKTINVTDVTIPVAESIELTGPNTFEITFSEPVKATESADVLINNGIYGVAKKTLSTDGRTLTVELGASSLSEGSYEVKVSGYADFANFAAMSKTFTLQYTKDASAPTVKLVSASQNEVVVEFDKAVTQKGGAKLTKDFFFHTYSAWKPVEVTTEDNKKFTLKFSDNNENTQDFILPEGDVTVTVLKSANDVKVVDMWGNELAADAKLKATIVADKEAPTVTKVEAKAENQLAVSFSEKVDLSSAKFVIKNSEGKVVSQTITKVNYDAEKMMATLDLSSKLNGGNYTVEVSEVVDTSLSKNKITAITLPFVVTDKTPIDLSSVTAKVVTNSDAKEQYIYVTFPEAVATSGTNSALNKDNYLVGGAALASADKVELFGTDNKRVKITVKFRDDKAVVTAGTVQDPETLLTLGRIADAAGNTNAALATDKVITADAATATFTAKAIGLNKLELVFDAELKTVTADGIEVDGSDSDDVKSTVAAIDNVEVKDGKTYVKVTVKATEKLANKSKAELDKMSVGIVDGKLETITGQKLSSVTPVAAGSVVDAIAPELEGAEPITLARTAANKAVITVDFDEDLATVGALDATDLIIKDANGKTYIPGTDYEVTLQQADASKLDITLTVAAEDLNKLNGTKFSVASKATVNYLDDVAGNFIKVFEAKQTKTALEISQ
ncbi:Ig-like domain-containing protein [Exiguobacterium sp. HVEsp1]|uniref:Ig-like domain-containing protein n=1 Tax=Exiguobacterium sp. HVEsp1 TaxID=1934003 RepID=UPI000990D396|nr:Ig-like domain-containing protein [Exiguobacterium sp. HVEsp1]